MIGASPHKIMFAACKKLGLDEDARHDLLHAITGKSSSKDLTPREWGRVIAHLNKLTSGPDRVANEWAWVDAASEDRQPLLRKLIMLAKSAGIEKGKQIAYLEGIAKQSGGLNPDGTAKIVKPLRMCDARELYVIVQALGVHVRRQAKQGANP